MRRQQGQLSPAQQQEVDVARKYFYAGFLFLPWLWAVSVLFHRRRLQDPDAPAQLKYYIQRSFVAFLVATALFLVWVVSFQMTWRHWGRSLLVVDTDSDW